MDAEGHAEPPADALPEGEQPTNVEGHAPGEEELKAIGPPRIGNYEIHPASWIIPELSDRDYELLKADIEEHGVRGFVELFEGKVIDGRAILRACVELEIDPPTRDITITDTPTDYVISKLKGRKPTPVQLACIAVLTRSHFAAKARARQQAAGGDRRQPLTDGATGSAPAASEKRYLGEWTAEAAQAVGAGVSAVKTMDLVSRSASDVFWAAHRGQVPTVEAARLLADEPEHAKMLDGLKLFGGDAQSATRYVREAVAQERRTKLLEAIPVQPLKGRDYRLFHGDLTEVGSLLDDEGQLVIPDGSIDKIITDPPYDFEAAHLLPALAKLAVRKLAPGGSIFVLMGGVLLPDVLDALRAEGLNYHWPLAWVSSRSTIVWNRNVLSQVKPILWFTKGAYTGRRIATDFVPSFHKEKDLHAWQQGEDAFAELLHIVCNPNDLILDPFCGSGTTGAAALSVGCRFIGIDQDGNAIKASADRLANLAQFMGGVRSFACGEFLAGLPHDQECGATSEDGDAADETPTTAPNTPASRSIPPEAPGTKDPEPASHDAGQPEAVKAAEPPAHAAAVPPSSATKTKTVSGTPAASRPAAGKPETGPTTPTSWSTDVKAAVASLPAEVRAQVQVGDVEQLDAVRCPTCGGTRFRMHVGGCPECEPVVSSMEIENRVGQRWVDAELARLTATGWIDEMTQASAKNAARAGLSVGTYVQRLANERAWKSIEHIGTDETPMKREIKEAIAVDPRILWADRLVNLRHPRQRVRIMTPSGAVDATLWECVNDADSLSRGVYPKPGVVLTGPDDRPAASPVILGVRGKEAMCNSQAAFRDAVCRVVMQNVRKAATATGADEAHDE